MDIRNAALALGSTFAALVVATPGSANLPDDLAVGTRIEAEGQRLDDRTMTAEEVEIQARRAGKDEIKGRITAVDAAAGRLRIHGVDLVLESDAKLEDDDGTTLTVADLEEGQYAEAEGVFRGGVLRTQELERGEPDPGEELKVELTGIVTELDARSSSLQVMGIEVRVTPRTVIEMK